jgi:hypothetical protein
MAEFVSASKMDKILFFTEIKHQPKINIIKLFAYLFVFEALLQLDL